MEKLYSLGQAEERARRVYGVGECEFSANEHGRGVDGAEGKRPRVIESVRWFKSCSSFSNRCFGGWSHAASGRADSDEMDPAGVGQYVSVKRND